MFLPENKGGLGFVSTLETDLILVRREFEIIANNVAFYSRSFRTRITALRSYETLFSNQNHARDALVKMAKYGIFVRDSHDLMINDILKVLFEKAKRYLPFNYPNYKDSCKFGIGLGKEKNVLFMLGGPVHSILERLQDNQSLGSLLLYPY